MTSLKEKKLAIYEWFANLKDDEIINIIFLMMTQQQEMPELTEEQKKRIEIGLAQLDNGNSISNEVLREKVSALFNKFK